METDLFNDNYFIEFIKNLSQNIQEEEKNALVAFLKAHGYRPVVAPYDASRKYAQRLKQRLKKKGLSLHIKTKTDFSKYDEQKEVITCNYEIQVFFTNINEVKKNE